MKHKVCEYRSFTGFAAGSAKIEFVDGETKGGAFAYNFQSAIGLLAGRRDVLRLHDSSRIPLSP